RAAEADVVADLDHRRVAAPAARDRGARVTGPGVDDHDVRRRQVPRDGFEQPLELAARVVQDSDQREVRTVQWPLARRAQLGYGASGKRNGAGQNRVTLGATRSGRRMRIGVDIRSLLSPTGRG